MIKEIVSESNSPKSAPGMLAVRRPMTTLVAALALIAYAATSALATQCEPVDFTDDGGYPGTVYVYATTATPGATIFATMGNYYIPADPTHNGGTPTGSTFICGGTFAVFSGQHKWFKAIAYKAGMTDSVLNIYEVDNSGN